MVFIRAGPTSSSQETTLAVTLSAKHTFKCVLMKMKMHVAGGTIPSGRKCGKETSMAAISHSQHGCYLPQEYRVSPMAVSRELLHMSDVFDSGSPADLNRLAAIASWDITSTITPPLVIHDLESANNIGLALGNIAIFISPKAQ